MRAVLTEDITRYLSPTGSDTNDGLTTATPWKTLQHAWDTLYRGYDLAGHKVTVHMASGHYDSGLAAYGSLLGGEGPSALTFTAATTYPPEVLVAPNSGSPFVAAFGACYSLKNLDVDASTAKADCISIGMSSRIDISGPADNFFFRHASRDPVWAGNHVSVAYGGMLTVNGNYYIRGDAQCHMMAGDGGRIYFNTNGLPNLIFVNLVGVRTFDVSFMNALGGGSINVAAITWTGSAIGKRYVARVNGVIYTEGGGPNYFPGNQAGLLETGGQYV